MIKVLIFHKLICAVDSANHFWQAIQVCFQLRNFFKNYMSHVMRKPVFTNAKKHQPRSAVLQYNLSSFYMSLVVRKQFFAYAKTKTQISFAVTAKLISPFVFATWIVQSLYFLNPKFQASSHLLWLTAHFVSDLVGNPEDRFSHNKAHISTFKNPASLSFCMLHRLVCVRCGRKPRKQVFSRHSSL